MGYLIQDPSVISMSSAEECAIADAVWFLLYNKPGALVFQGDISGAGQENEYRLWHDDAFDIHAISTPELHGSRHPGLGGSRYDGFRMIRLDARFLDVVFWECVVYLDDKGLAYEAETFLQLPHAHFLMDQFKMALKIKSPSMETGQMLIEDKDAG